MAEHDQAPGTEWAFLWGKRNWRRQATDVMVGARLDSLDIPGYAGNVSAGGVLLEIPTPMIRHLVPPGGELNLFALQSLFTRPFTVRLGPNDVERRVEGVRIDWRPEEPDFVYVGCQLQRPLTDDEVEALGFEARITLAEMSNHVLTAADMAWQVRGDASARFEAEREGQDTLYVGEVTAMHGRDLALLIEGTDPTALVADLAQEQIVVRILDHDRVQWDTAAWLLGVRSLNDGRMEMVVQTEEMPPSQMRDLFQIRCKAPTA